MTSRVALVSGSGRGIGRAIARALAEDGVSVAVNYVKRDEPANELVEEIRARGGTAVAYGASVSDPDECREMVTSIVHDLGDVDILVNNAGAAWGAPAEDHPVEAWDKVMNLNIRGYFILSQHVAKRSMIERRSGRIINLASIAGLGGNPPEMQTLAYNTSKSAVIGFTHTLAAEWGKYNITVNAICPGFFMTKMAAGLIKSLGEEKMAAQAPLGRLGDDEDLKGLTLLYASDAGKHITGQWLAVDGGVSVVLGAA